MMFTPLWYYVSREPVPRFDYVNRKSVPQPGSDFFHYIINPDLYAPVSALHFRAELLPAQIVSEHGAVGQEPRTGGQPGIIPHDRCKIPVVLHEQQAFVSFAVHGGRMRTLRSDPASSAGASADASASRISPSESPAPVAAVLKISFIAMLKLL